MNTAPSALRLLAAAVACLFAALPTAGSGGSEAPAGGTQADERADEPLRAAAREQAAALARSVPEVDLGRHAVPLDRVVFDTFQSRNRQLPLTRATPEQIAALRDAIPPLHFPRYETAHEATWMRDDEAVIGYSAAGEAWAYPVRILNLHEIVNDHLGGRPVLVSFCPLCFSAVVFDRRVGETELMFGNTSALYQSDMVMLDYQTGSYWWQVAGEAIVGAMNGERMEPLPSITISWQQWRTAHPDTLVLSRDTGTVADYPESAFAGYAAYLDAGNFAFPVDEELLDRRLAPSTKVVVVGSGAAATAFVLTYGPPTVINAVVDGRPVVVFTEPSGPSAAVFDRPGVAGTMTFAVRDGAYVDETTGSEWSFAGVARRGPEAGVQLQLVASTTALWFAAATAYPELRIHRP